MGRLVFEVDDISISRGRALPLGATPARGGINFAVFSKNATRVELLLFAPGEDRTVARFELDPMRNRTGDVWHALVTGVESGIEYGWVMGHEHNQRPQVHRYDPNVVLIDPYARAVTGGEVWGEQTSSEDEVADHVYIKRRRSLAAFDEFDWRGDQPLNVPMAETIIYELHVRGYTRHESAGVANAGTYAGLAECIPYLKELGVTAVELLPVNEFEEADTDRKNPVTKERLLNFWGYHPIAFFAPNSSYSSNR